MATVAKPTPTSLDNLSVEIDIDALTVGSLIDLEQAVAIADQVTWFTTYTSLTVEQLRSLPLKDYKPLAEKISAAVKDAISPN